MTTINTISTEFKTEFSTFKNEKIKCELIGVINTASYNHVKGRGQFEYENNANNARLTWGFGSIQSEDFDNFKEAMKGMFKRFADKRVPVAHTATLTLILLNGANIDELTFDQQADLE